MAHLGSFAASLAVPEALRPWAQSGLAALFLPGGLPVQPEVAAEQGEQGASAGPVVHANASTPASPASSAMATGPRWPEPWRGLAGRVRENPRVIITYTDLALDLSGTPHPGRRKLLRDILGYLAWPQGTSLFWPLCSLREGKLCPAPEIFAAGVRHYGVSHLACFGPDAADLARAHVRQEEGVPTILTLPAPQDLLSLLPHELHLAVKALKGLVIK